MMAKARMVFMGSDPIALPCLSHLLDGDHARERLEILAVYTQPDRARGRGKQVQPNTIKTWAQAMGIPVRQPTVLGTDEAAWLRAQKLEFILVMAYGHILRKPILESPAYGIFNLHASILPKYRGASPIETAVAEGETETGVSLMQIVPRMDAGPVADVEPVAIAPDDTAAAVRDRLAEACVPLVSRNLEGLISGTLRCKPQDESRATYCRRLTKDDAQLDFSAPALTLSNRIRAFAHWPGTYCHHQETRLRINRAGVEPEPEQPAAASTGKVLSAGAEGIRLATGTGQLVVEELQRPGGKSLHTREFLNGYRIKPGQYVTGGPMRPLVSSKPFPWKRPPANPE